MKYLRPVGTLIEINGKMYRLKFTLDVIYELQYKVKMPIGELMWLLTNYKTRKLAVQCVFKYALGTVEIDDTKLDYYSSVILDTYINQLKYKGMTPSDEEVNEDKPRFDYMDIENLIYVGTVVLGYREQDVWEMTYGKIKTLIKEHYKYHGIETKEVTIDDVIPF